MQFTEVGGKKKKKTKEKIHESFNVMYESNKMELCKNRFLLDHSTTQLKNPNSQ